VPIKALVVPDKFKGTLTAQSAAEAIARGWRESRPGDVLDLLPMSDGGDGFGEIMSQTVGAETIPVTSINAAHEPIEARWWWNAKERTAIIESANVIGLALLPHGKFHPFDLDTGGLGEVFHAAMKRGASSCMVGIGGSATNDGGFGVAKRLGWRFLDARGGEITKWTDLEKLERLEEPPGIAKWPEVIVAVDVQNPLLGPEGCSRIYGPQKGLKAVDFPKAEACLGRLREVAKEHSGRDCATLAGAGAAGGLGFGLAEFANARLVSGFELFSTAARLAERIRASALVVTGEGSIDRSTLMGKGTGQVAALCARLGVPCIGLGGRVDLDGAPAETGLFARTAGIVPRLASFEDSRRAPETWLARLASEAARGWRAE
jgi:glycerate kinase